MSAKRQQLPDITRMNDVQLLAHLLDMSGMETSAAREMSHALLDEYKDLNHVLHQPQDKLLGYPHLGESAATFLLLLPALMKRYTSTTAPAPMPLEGPLDIAQLLAPHFHGQSFERVCAFLLGDEMQPITSILVAQGGRAAVSCSLRRTMELILNHRARGVLLAHNHPDGVAAFSKSDLISTGLLTRELSLVGIPLLDHYLVADRHILSMRRYAGYLKSVGIRIPGLLQWFPFPE